MIRREDKKTYVMYLAMLIAVIYIFIIMPFNYNKDTAKSLCEEINQTYNDRLGLEKVECNNIIYDIKYNCTYDKWGKESCFKREYYLVIGD